MRLNLGRILLIWCVGLYLRLAVLAVPPLIPDLIGSMHLGNGEVSVLVSLPMLMFAVGMLISGYVLKYITPSRMIIAGLLIMATGSMARAMPLTFAELTVATFVIGIGIAAMQAGLPIYLRAHYPSEVGRATAIYTNALMCGEVLVTSLTLPLVHMLGHNQWRFAFLIWSAPALLVAGWMWFARFQRTKVDFQQPDRYPTQVSAKPAILKGLRLGLLIGGTGSLYFGSNTFFPIYLHAAGQGRFLGEALATLNGCQLLSSGLLIVLGERAYRTKSYFAGFALMGITSVALLWAVPSGIAYVLLGGFVGFSTAGMLTIALALVAKQAAGRAGRYLVTTSLAVGYALVFIVPTFGGALADWTHRLSIGIAPAVAIAVVMLVAYLLTSQTT